jgi:hypothetical protein
VVSPMSVVWPSSPSVCFACLLVIQYCMFILHRAHSTYALLTPGSTFVDKMTKPEVGPCTNNPLCIKGKEHEPLLQNLRIGLIDPDTPASVKTRISSTGKKQHLVFSDEFNTDGRTFYDGDDPYFQAVDIWYGATQDLEVSRAAILSGISF